MRCPRALTALLSTVVAVPAAVLVAAAPAPAVPGAAPPPGTYTNPVSAGTVDTFPDPSVVKAKDGLWYAYGTTNPIFNSRGENGEHILPVMSSPDLVHWTYEGDVFAPGEQPAFWPDRARAWAPDIRYVDGLYHLTYALSSGGIALVTSEHPDGPWTDRGLVVANGNPCPSGTIDQAMFTDSDGTHYLYWGSYDTICVSRMNASATALTGEVTQVAQGRRAEGAFVVAHGGWYYLMFSDAGCCDGEFSGYTVKVGRSSSPTGPFVTADGQSLMDRRSKGGIVLTSNGNGFAGPGHNAVATDLAGQDWIVYHAIPTADPNFPPVNGATGGTLQALAKRPLMIDRLDWVDGWPVARAGAGPSAGPQPAPVTTPLEGSDFTDGPPATWSGTGNAGAWSAATATDAGGVLAQTASPSSLSTFGPRASLDGDLRVEADVRLTDGTSGAVGVTVDDRGANHRVTVLVDRASGSLVVRTADGKDVLETSSPLPDSYAYDAWHTVAVEVRGDALTAEVSADRLLDPLATVTATVPARLAGQGRVAAASVGAPAQVDNVAATPLSTPVTERVPDPELGDLLPQYSDEFDGTGDPAAADPAWSWVRGPADGVLEQDGALTFPTQGAELYRGTNTASVLLRDAPTDQDYVVETTLGFDGTQGNQQAGLVLYGDDDHYLKLTHTVLPLARVGTVTHQTEFGKEGPRPTTVPSTPVFNAPMFGGPPAATTWLRLLVHRDTAHDEYDVRMASSTDGEQWTWGGVWSVPLSYGPLRTGLVSMNTPGATATFEDVRTYAVADLGGAMGD